MVGNRVRFAAFAILGMLISTVVTPSANAATRNVIVLSGGSHPELQQVRAELAALGFQLVLVEADPNVSIAERLLQVAREQKVPVAVELDASSNVLRVRLYDAVSEHEPVSQLFPREPATGASHQDEAVRVAEYIRVVFLKTEAKARRVKPTYRKRTDGKKALPTPEHEVEPSRVEEELSDDEAEVDVRTKPRDIDAQSLWLGASSGLLLNSGTHAASQFIGTMAWRADAPLSFALRALVPISSSRVEYAEGTSSVTTWSAMASTRYELPSVTNRRVSLGAGLCLVDFHTKGTSATSGYGLASPVDLVVVSTSVEASLSVKVRQSFAVTTSLFVAYALRDPVVRFSGHDVASLGRPMIGLSIGVDLRVAGKSHVDTRAVDMRSR